MTSPGTIKSFQKRIYTVATRVRSNSATRNLYTTPSSSPSPPSSLPLSFFDSLPPPPPATRPSNPHVLSTSRLPIKGDGSSASGEHHSSTQPPFSLALTSPHPNSQPHSPQGSGSYPTSNPFFPYSNPFAPLPFYSTHAESCKERLGAGKRTRYQLDVGAYGIAKRGGKAGVKLWEQHQAECADDLGLAVQVGEDAYFIRDNAMGVADGVGGWARTRHNDPSPPDPSPSALFARRLMNFCSAETEVATPTSFTFPNHTRPTPWSWSSRPHHTPTLTPYDDLDMDMEQSSEMDAELEEFEEGLDVLMILERAYESAIKAHVVPSASTPAPTSRPSPHPTSNPSPSNTTKRSPTPLLEGSSTALLAVLDHSPRPTSNPPSRPRSTSPTPTQKHLSSSSPSTRTPSPSLKNPGPTPRPPPKSKPTNGNTEHANGENDARRANGNASGAVLKIAHLGDCMGMLVRGEDIVWRSEEMWWNFNTPVQLGPQSPSKPSTHARTFTLPIEQDDILILASDGLSDNLWDEDVLDEVVRMRRSFLPPPSSPSPSSSQPLSSSGTSSPPTSTANDTETKTTNPPSPPPTSLLGRRTLAGMLSEALCSRARRVSEHRPRSSAASSKFSCEPAAAAVEDEVPFARRAREQGKVFRGGKADDISVVVAVISPADVHHT